MRKTNIQYIVLYCSVSITQYLEYTNQHTVKREQRLLQKK